MICRLHGEPCRTPWGYDEVHTDSDHPYTLDELATRSDAPHRYAYPASRDYVLGFLTWRQIRRDNRPNDDEADVRFAGWMEELSRRYPDVQWRGDVH